MVMEVPGKTWRGRPKRTLLDNIKNDLSERELSGEDAQDRAKWRRLIRHIDPTYKWEKMRKMKNRRHISVQYDSMGFLLARTHHIQNVLLP